MKLILLTFFFLVSLNVKAEPSCLKTSVKSYMSVMGVNEYISIVHSVHNLVFSKESCGYKGCELFVFSEIFPGCIAKTFHKKSFLIPNSFRRNRISVKEENQRIDYKFSHRESRFLVIQDE